MATRISIEDHSLVCANGTANVLVTGGAGFIGSHLVKRLRALHPDHVIVVVDNLSRGRMENLMVDGKYVIEPLRDFKKADLTVAKEALDTVRCAKVVYHLADIVAGIDYVFGHQSSLFRENVLINTNTLHAVVANRIPNYIYVGTACSFPKHLQMSYEIVALHENQTYPASPESSYGWSKLMGEYEALLLSNQRDTEFTPNVSVLRFHNVYGPGMIWGTGAQAISALLFKAMDAEDGKPFEVFGSGNQYRDFVFVDDIVNALLLAHRAYGRGVVQIGTGVGVSIRELSDDISGIVSHGMDKHTFPRFQIGGLEGDRGRVAVVERAERILGWKAYTNLSIGLEKTFQYMLSEIRNQERVSSGAYPSIRFQSRSRPMKRNLVIVIGQPRGGDLAHRSLHEYLLKPNDADLAIFFGNESSNSTILHQYARYIWEVPELPDWTVMALDFARKCKNNISITQDEMWGPRIFLGKKKSDPQHTMSSFLLLAFRWLVYQKIVEMRLHFHYENFVLTRADELHMCNHFPLQEMKERCPKCAWVQKGEEYGGFSDRHWAAPAEIFMRLINVTQSITCNPRPYFRTGIYNIESLLKVYTKQENIEVMKFDPTFFTVRAPNDTTRWSKGKHEELMSSIGLKLKYPNEYVLAKGTCHSVVPDPSVWVKNILKGLWHA